MGSNNPAEGEFPYTHVYFTGASLTSTQSFTLDIEVAYSVFGIIPQWMAERQILPKETVYYQGRVTNGPVFAEFVSTIFPRDVQVYNFARPGAACNDNFLNHFVVEKIKREVPWYCSLDAYFFSAQPSLTDQYDKIIVTESERKSTQFPSDRGLVVMWEIGHNDMLALPYYAGMANKWVNCPSFSRDNVEKMEKALAKKVQQGTNSTVTYIRMMVKETPLRDFVVIKCAPIHLTPYFYEIKQKYSSNARLIKLIDSMADTYNSNLVSAIDELKKEFVDQNISVNITVIDQITAEGLPEDFYKTSWLGEESKRNGKVYDLSKASPKDLAAMEKVWFYDPVHLSERGHRWLASFVADKLMTFEPNLAAYFGTHKRPDLAAIYPGVTGKPARYTELKALPEPVIRAK